MARNSPLCFGLFNAIYNVDEFLKNAKDFSDRSVGAWQWIRDKILATDWSIDDPIFFWCIWCSPHKLIRANCEKSR